jgi:hypothetical protein
VASRTAGSLSSTWSKDFTAAGWVSPWRCGEQRGRVRGETAGELDQVKTGEGDRHRWGLPRGPKAHPDGVNEQAVHVRGALPSRGRLVGRRRGGPTPHECVGASAAGCRRARHWSSHTRAAGKRLGEGCVLEKTATKNCTESSLRWSHRSRWRPPSVSGVAAPCHELCQVLLPGQARPPLKVPPSQRAPAPPRLTACST